MKGVVVFSLLISLTGAVLAIDKQGPLPTPEMQARYEHLTNELRCLVCQNQTVADSNADLAKDLRRQTREMILAGRTDEEIKKYMTDRYGEFVLYRPPLNTHTVLLWAAPGLLLLVGAAVAFSIIRRRSRESALAAGPDTTAQTGGDQ